MTGGLTLGASGTTAHLLMELGGVTAGSGYDQVSVLAGSTLNLTNVNLDGSLINGYTPAVKGLPLVLNGSLYFLVIGAAGHTGAFANQQAADANSNGFNTITIGGAEFAISYTGNAGSSTFTGGNDVALMAIPEPCTGVMLLGGFGMFALLRGIGRRSG